jgi:hypothetical protein
MAASGVSRETFALAENLLTGQIALCHNRVKATSGRKGTAHMTKTNYIAKLDGKIIGTRSSERAYTHAVVIQHSEAWYREQAHSVAYAKGHNSKSNFDYYVKIADGGVDAERAEYKYTPLSQIEERVAEAVAIRDMGYDAWVEQRRQANIARHEASNFQPAVLCWNGRLDLAQKEAAKYQGRPGIANVWVVEAEKVAKLPKIKGERKHVAYGPHSG